MNIFALMGDPPFVVAAAPQCHSENLRFSSCRAFALSKKGNINFLTCKHDENLYFPFSALLIVYIIMRHLLPL